MRNKYNFRNNQQGKIYDWRKKEKPVRDLLIFFYLLAVLIYHN